MADGKLRLHLCRGIAQPHSVDIVGDDEGVGLAARNVAASLANAGAAATASSLLQVEEPNVVLFGLPKSETGDGIGLHLRETAGQQKLAHIKVGALNVHHATLCNLIETPQGALKVQDGTIEVPLRPWAIAAVRIKWHQRRPVHLHNRSTWIEHDGALDETYVVIHTPCSSLQQRDAGLEDDKKLLQLKPEVAARSTPADRRMDNRYRLIRVGGGLLPATANAYR
jgi:hypothetical protein